MKILTRLLLIAALFVIGVPIVLVFLIAAISILGPLASAYLDFLDQLVATVFYTLNR